MDQRTDRIMAIGSVDLASSARNAKRDLRKMADESRQNFSEASCKKIAIEKITAFSSTDSSEDQDSEYEPSSSTKRRMDSTLKTVAPMETLALLADKTGVSDRVAATIASAALVANTGNNELEYSKNIIVID